MEAHIVPANSPLPDAEYPPAQSDEIGSQLPKRLKAVAGWMLFRTGLYRRLFRGRAAIVLFHRISDKHPQDRITCGVGEFDAFLKFFGQFFTVITLSTLLELLSNGGDLEGKVVVTFDDGYRDNATVAARLLESHGMRGSFFLLTGYIGTDRVPSWDAINNIDTEWLTWDQARSLQSAGHDLGSHTNEHPDLGKVKGEAARLEIETGKQKLEAELGQSSGLFAHPFGWHGRMAPENTQLVKNAGLRCDLSAFGGTVSPGDDPYRLKRIAISQWFASPYQFGFELVTGKLESN